MERTNPRRDISDIGGRGGGGRGGGEKGVFGSGEKILFSSANLSLSLSLFLSVYDRVRRVATTTTKEHPRRLL